LLASKDGAVPANDNRAPGTYQDLRGWQRPMELAETCYAATRQFPKDELYGLTSQIRRAAVSIAANIAEGYGREGRGEFIRFLRVAQGSLKELETYAVLCRRIQVGTEKDMGRMAEECETVGKMLRSFIRKLQARDQG
jgi:four helix bundle protein